MTHFSLKFFKIDFLQVKIEKILNPQSLHEFMDFYVFVVFDVIFVIS